MTVKKHPTGQVCTALGAGQIQGANITNVVVTCTAATYNVGGSVSGLTGAGLVLQNNGGDNLAIAANGAFTFATGVANGSAYNVTVQTQPSGQACTVTNGAGTINSAAVNNVGIACVAACSVGGPTVIDPTGNTFPELAAITTAAGNVLVGWRGGGGDALRIYSTNCQRATVAAPYEAYAFGLHPMFARFGNGTNALGIIHPGSSCSIAAVDDNGTVTATTTLLTTDTSLNGVSVANLASGNVMVACRDSSGIRTWVVDSSPGIVSGPNTIPGNYVVSFGRSLTELSDGRVIMTYRDDGNSQRGTLRVLNASGAAVAGPTVFTGAAALGWHASVSLGATALVIYGETTNTLKMIEVDTNGSVVSGPFTLDSVGTANWVTAEKATDGSIYVAYFPSGHTAMRWLRVSAAGTVLSGPNDFGSSGNIRPYLTLTNGHMVLTTGEGIYVISQ